MAADATIEGFIKTGSLSEEEAQAARERAAELVKEAARPYPGGMPPLGELLGEVATKSPKFIQFLDQFRSDPKRLLMLAGLAAAAGGGSVLAQGAAQAGVHGADDLAQSLMKGGRYRKMLDQHPDLAEYDATDVQRAFTTLNRFNPEIAADPLVAGTFVQQIMGMGGGIPHKTVDELVGTRAKMKRPVGQQGALAAGGSAEKVFTEAMKGVGG